jgi:hypothetical protein
MTADKDNSSRAEAVRQRLQAQKKQAESKPVKRVAVSADPRLFQTPGSRARSASPSTGSRRRYNIALGAGIGSQVQLPAIPKVSAGPRWVSFVLALACGALLYLMWNVEPFIIVSSEAYGNVRVSVGEINGVLGLVGASSVEAVPADAEQSLLKAFPEFAAVSVEVKFPAQVVVRVVERVPVIAWQHNNQTMWIDADGVAFLPRGEAENLLPVLAIAPPPALAADPDTVMESVLARRFLAPESILAFQALSAHVPAGAILVYDPRYGMGWTDTRGWQAYFGQGVSDIPLKLQVYYSMVDWLLSQGVQPEIISVEYPHAPFYRVEQ